MKVSDFANAMPRVITGALIRGVTVGCLGIGAIARVPVAAAHDQTSASLLSQWHGLLILFLGILLLAGTVYLKRTNNIRPTVALYAVFLSLVITVIGAILFEGLSPDQYYTVESMPFPRSWYAPMALTLGLVIAVCSFLIGYLRWPDRPRYAVFGLLIGLWISYPVLIPGRTSESHPLGYVLVLSTPIAVGYILWKDTHEELSVLLGDPVARRFGIGVGILAGLFFMTASGYISFFWEAGVPHETAIVVLPVIYQLVIWPTLEVALPQFPLFVAISVGIATIVGTLSILIGLNASVIARHWRQQEQAGFVEGTTGTAAIVGACTCGCCGPLVAKVAVVAAGPSIAAPVYWVFVDTASPFSSLFIIGSIALFTGTLVYAVDHSRGFALTAG